MGHQEDIKAQVEAIKEQVVALPAQQEAELRAWLNDRDFAAWDTQIERDLNDGKLDSLIAEAERERAGGHGRDL